MNVDYRSAHYIMAVAGALEDGERIETDAMTERCPECNQVQTLLDNDEHLVMRRTTHELDPCVFVVIACEGYWVIDPKPLGVPGDNSGWSDWRSAEDIDTPDDI